jgi:hypothetical protein
MGGIYLRMYTSKNANKARTWTIISFKRNFLLPVRI